MLLFRRVIPQVFKLRYKTQQIRNLKPTFQQMKFSFPHNSVFASSIRFQQHQQQRWKSTSSKKSKSEVPTITKQELQNLIGQNKGDYVLIDVREPSEYAAGHIETSHNIPIKECMAFLTKSEEEWLKKFNFPKPSRDSCIIFYCQEGNRSATATVFARFLGYKNAKNYRGSWAEWSKTTS